MNNFYIKQSPLTGMVGYGGGGTGLTFNNISAPAWFGDRGLYGHKNNTNQIEYFNIASSGNSSDFGDMTAHTGSARTGVAGSGLGILCGGYSGGETNWISYVTIKTPGNTTDFGDLSFYTREGGTACDGTRALYSGGIDESSATGGGNGSDFRSNRIDYFSVLTTGNGADFGDLTHPRSVQGAVNDATRAVFYGGYKLRSDQTNPSKESCFVTIQTAGNASTFGATRPDGPSAHRTRNGMQSACSDQGRGLFAGGLSGGSTYDNSSYTNEIEYITISTLGDGVDFGDLTIGRGTPGRGNSSNKTRGVFLAGELESGGSSNIMDYITFDSTGNATDLGDLGSSSSGGFACAN